MTETQEYIDYEHESGVTARWHGGEYIELGYVAADDTGPFNDLGQPSWYKGQFVSEDVINVWDANTGEATIPFTLEALREAVDEHLDEA